jgi:hypothetical protein
MTLVVLVLGVLLTAVLTVNAILSFATGPLPCKFHERCHDLSWLRLQAAGLAAIGSVIAVSLVSYLEP